MEVKMLSGERAVPVLLSSAYFQSEIERNGKLFTSTGARIE
jgi:hypothetical protein